MLDLFIKLIEKLVELAKEKKRLKRSLHDDYVLPLMQQFENVHQEYITSFQEYREIIVAESPNFSKTNGVFAKLKSDMIFSHSSRKKLMAMSEGMIPNKCNYPGEDSIDRFIWIVFDYVHSISDSTSNRDSNLPRRSLLEALQDIVAGNRLHEELTPSQEAEREVLEKMWDMQKLYTDVQYAYQEAKKDLLK